MQVSLSETALRAMLEAAYEDGFEDGVNAMVESHSLEEPVRNDHTGKYTCPDDWDNSVTLDRITHAMQDFRNGKSLG